MRLAKPLQETLTQLGAAGSSWTIRLGLVQREHVLKLEKLGLVKLRPYYTASRVRGQCRGHMNGYDVVLTSAGRDLLR